jgi:AcrR family transcriptional regulator
VPVNTRPRRRLDAVRRPLILATAVELVREKGLWNVRISDIANRAGVSPANVVYYFGTKDQLFADAITAADDAFYDSLVPELEGLQDAVERIALLIVRSSTSDWLMWMDLWVYARRHPDMAEAQRGFNRRWRAAIADVIRHGESTGAWQLVDADEAALRLAAVTDGLAVHMVLDDPDYGPERYVAMSLAAVALELGCDLEALRGAAENYLPAAEIQ